MDPQRFKDAFERLESLDQRLSHKIRPKSALKQPSVEQMSEQMKDLSNYTLELKDIVRELFQSIAGRPAAGS